MCLRLDYCSTLLAGYQLRTTVFLKCWLKRLQTAQLVSSSILNRLGYCWNSLKLLLATRSEQMSRNQRFGFSFEMLVETDTVLRPYVKLLMVERSFWFQVAYPRLGILCLLKFASLLPCHHSSMALLSSFYVALRPQKPQSWLGTRSPRRPPRPSHSGSWVLTSMAFNPFTASACKMSVLKDARAGLQTV